MGPHFAASFNLEGDYVPQKYPSWQNSIYDIIWSRMESRGQQQKGPRRRYSLQLGSVPSRSARYLSNKTTLIQGLSENFVDTIELDYKYGRFQFLAHLSRRLTRWAYSIPMVRRPSVVIRRCRRPHFQTWISLKPVSQSWSSFMSSITRMGKGCIRFWDRLDQNSRFPWQQKAPINL